jgi:hypothetical protein
MRYDRKGRNNTNIHAPARLCPTLPNCKISGFSHHFTFSASENIWSEEHFSLSGSVDRLPSSAPRRRACVRYVCSYPTPPCPVSRTPVSLSATAQERADGKAKPQRLIFLFKMEAWASSAAPRKVPAGVHVQRRRYRGGRDSRHGMAAEGHDAQTHRKKVARPEAGKLAHITPHNGGEKSE